MGGRQEGRAEEGRQEGCSEEGRACEEGGAQEGREEGREEGGGEEGRGEEGAAGEEAGGEEGRAQGRAEHHQQALCHAAHRRRQGRHARPGVRPVGSENIVAHVERRLPLDRTSMLAAAFSMHQNRSARCVWQYLSTRSVVVSSVSSGAFVVQK